MKNISDNKIFSEKSKNLASGFGEELPKIFRDYSVFRMGIEEVYDVFQTGWIQNDYYLVFVVKDGEYLLRKEDGFEEFSSGQLLVIPPHTQRQIILQSGQGVHMFIHVTNREMWPIIGDAITITDFPYTRQLFDAGFNYLEERKKSEPGLEVIAAKFAEIMFLYLTHQSESEFSLLEREQLKKLRQIWQEVEAFPDKKWTVEVMAKKMFITPGHFHCLCKRLAGVSPIEKVIQIRMEKACSLLLQQSDSLETIAKAVGYESSFSFSRLFKKHIGIRPGKYRRDLSL